MVVLLNNSIKLVCTLLHYGVSSFEEISLPTIHPLFHITHKYFDSNTDISVYYFKYGLNDTEQTLNDQV